MAIKKKDEKRQELPFEEEDPALNAHKPEGDDPVTRDMARRRRARGMTPYQRRKAARDRARAKLTVDLPQEVIEEITQIANEKKVSISQLTAVLLVYGLRALREGEIDLARHMRATTTPRFEWLLDPYRDDGQNA